MLTAKQKAIKTIDQLPDDADMDEIMYRLYVLDKARKGQEAVAQGNTLANEAFKRAIDAW